MTSIGLFVLKRRIEEHLDLKNSLPVGILLTTTTIRDIFEELEKRDQDSRGNYNSVMLLQFNKESRKSPLWLVHPGFDDVLIFLALTKCFPDRTVYELRTRGLNTGLDDHNYFDSIADIADTYVESIKQHQLKGSYVIAGYSLGSTVAFEIAKRFEAAGENVAFLGMFDSPPHMRRLIEKLDWIDVLLNVAYFLELIDEGVTASISKDLRQGTPDEALEFILACAPRQRLEALSIDKSRLQKNHRRHTCVWASGEKSVAGSRREWMDNHLIQWKDFSAQPPCFHECDGSHSRMLNPEYVDSFQKILKSAMAARGV